MGEDEEKFTTVPIPTPLIIKIEERIKGTNFASVSGYITYVLREIVREEEDETPPLTQEDMTAVKDRLRALGYMD
jgi:Arc/MetJ-type ribon-helix-helix transcriptional regulator